MDPKCLENGSDVTNHVISFGKSCINGAAFMGDRGVANRSYFLAGGGSLLRLVQEGKTVTLSKNLSFSLAGQNLCMSISDGLFNFLMEFGN